MARSHSIVPLLLIAGLLASGRLAGQPQPISKQLEIAPPRVSLDESVQYYHFAPSALSLANGGFAVVWSTDYRSTAPSHASDGVFPETGGVWLDRLGRSVRLLAASTGVADESSAGPPVVARSGPSGFVAVYCLWGEGADLWFRRFDGDGRPLDAESRIVGDHQAQRSDAYPSAAGNAEGRFAIVWQREDFSDPSVFPPPRSLVLQIFDASGEAATPEIEIAPPASSAIFGSSAVGMDAAGNVVVLWQGSSREYPTGGTWFRRYDRQGQPIEAPRRLGDWGFGDLALAMGPDGGFVGAWGIGQADAARTHPLLLTRFRPDGTQSGVSVEVHRSRQLFHPALASDRFGNLALFWVEGTRSFLALFNGFLLRGSADVMFQQGPVVMEAPASLGVYEPNRGSVALADDGRLLTVWLGPHGPRARDSVLGRLWQARKDADLCVLRGFHVLCDTANDGGQADLRFPFGQSGDALLLGDVDGNGRAEPCVFRGDRILCGEAGGAPTLDTGLAIPAGAQPLLADVEGDGKADPCYRAGAFWGCALSSAPPSTAPNQAWFFGSGDAPGALGDVDGNGRAEACVFRKGLFLCDTGHDGGIAEVTFDLSSALGRARGGTPLLGDVDGDGRADPCVYDRGRLTCGIFKPAGGKPVRILTLSFGKAGDLPALGDLDAF